MWPFGFTVYSQINFYMTWFPAQHHDGFLIPQYAPLPPGFPSNEVHRSPLHSTANAVMPIQLSIQPVCVCAQAHLTLCDPMDWSPPDSSVREIFLARILEWVAMPSFRGSSWSRDQTHLSCISCTGRWAAQGTSGKEPACQRRRRKRCRFHPWVGKISLRSARQPTPIFLSGESHGQRSLADYSPGVAKSQKWLKQLSTRIQKNHWLLNRSPIRISKAKLKT